jgi:two-component system chemotaxis response regulator CheB
MSAAAVFRQNTVGILLSGIGDDGAKGFAAIKEKMGLTIVKDIRACVFPNLTDNAIRQGVVDMILDEPKMSETLESVMR